MTLAASPGTLMRTEVSVPPYMPPYMMPASMTIALVGSTPKVSGRSSAMPADVPMPGSAPTIWPRTTPIRTKRRFVGDRAVAKPSARRLRDSIIGFPAEISEAERPRGQIDLQPPEENAPDHTAGDERGDDARHDRST